ncbi:MAG: DUF2007 domain-containing protein [Peptococcaceae bacterium]|nr:DUF2007 domain-containing protein [Peptococcaceae bacterium]
MKNEVSGKLVALTNLQTEMEAEMLMDILRQENISVLTKDHGTGSYMKLYMGFSIFGETLYVYESDYSRASEILLALQQGSEAAIHAEQETAFSDADDFDAYEVEQIEKREAEAGIPKKNSPVPLIAVILLLLFLFTIVR